MSEIKCAAIRYERILEDGSRRTEVQIGPNHYYISEMIYDMEIKADRNSYEYGFVDEFNHFYDRRQAFKIAYQHDQLTDTYKNFNNTGCLESYMLKKKENKE